MVTISTSLQLKSQSNPLPRLRPVKGTMYTLIHSFNHCILVNEHKNLTCEFVHIHIDLHIHTLYLSVNAPAVYFYFLDMNFLQLRVYISRCIYGIRFIFTIPFCSIWFRHAGVVWMSIFRRFLPLLSTYLFIYVYLSPL